VAFRHQDRIARELLPAEQFYRYLRTTRTELYLHDLVNGRVDWDRDRMILQSLGVAGEHERRRFFERSSEGIIRKRMEEGRGHTAFCPMGFRRDAEDFLEVDPEVWPFIERIHFDYAPMTLQGASGLRRLADHLTGLGFPISREQCRIVLKNEIYVTGQWQGSYLGITYPGRPIRLNRPIPRELFESNQALLDIHTAKYRSNPPGTFLLNSVELVHEPCMEIERDGRRPRLSGTRNTQGKLRYQHAPFRPEGCRGWSIDAAVLERTVIDALVRLARDPELQTAYARNARTQGAVADGKLSEPEQLALEQRIEVLESQRREVDRRWVNRLADGGEPDIDWFIRLAEPLDHEIGALRRPPGNPGLDRQDDTARSARGRTRTYAARRQDHRGPDPRGPRRRRASRTTRLSSPSSSAASSSATPTTASRRSSKVRYSHPTTLRRP
jgi:hypothetical protein